MPRRLDLLPLAACALVLAIVTLYLVLVSLEDDRPRWWAVSVLATGVVGTAYASSRRAPLRRVVLVLCAVLLGGLGYLAILTIGMPILLAAGLCVAAVLRGRPARDWRDSV